MAFAGPAGDDGSLITADHLFVMVLSLAADVANDFGPATMLELPQPLHLGCFPHLLLGISQYGLWRPGEAEWWQTLALTY